MKVLDLGCGDGMTAVPAAQRGADVLGVDIASNLVAAGNRCVAELGLGNWPGAWIVMGNWIPGDSTLVAQILKISSACTPPPPPEGFISPMTWGIEPNVIERFGARGGAAGEHLLRAGHGYVRRLSRRRSCASR